MARQNLNQFFENPLRFQKTLVLASMLAAFAASVVVADEVPAEAERAEPPAVEEVAAPQVVDSDGDFIPDDSDPLPFIANVPVHWAVRQLSVTRTSTTPPLSDSWKDSLSLVLSAVPAPVSYGKPSTARPLPPGKAGGDALAALGLYGSGDLPWGDLQRVRTSRFLEGFRRDGASPLTLTFKVAFTGVGAAPLTFADIAVPVSLGGRKYADAVPAGNVKKLDVPSCGKTKEVDFVAEIPADDAGGFLSRLAKGDVSPLFRFEDAVDAELALRNVFESVTKKTVEISVSEPAGLVWRWRVARSADMTFGMWVAEMNDRFARLCGAPFATFAGTYPASVCGWENAALGQWWTVAADRSAVNPDELCALRLSAPIALSLSPACPRNIPEEAYTLLTNQVAAAAVYPDCLADAIAPNLEAKAQKAALADVAWHGGAEAWFRLGCLLLDADSHEGIDWLELAASRGSVPAYARLAKVFQNGEFDRERDPKAAVAYFQKAADGGDIPSMVALAEKYRAGEGVRKNAKVAVRYFAQAAEAGNLDARTWYAVSLLEGAGVRKDADAGLESLRGAAEAGHDVAQYLLAVVLFAGYDGVEKNQGEAFALFTSASKTQIAAKVFLGYCHLNGLGTSKNETQAVACFREAADAEVPAAYLWLAYCYANGLGIEKNVETARNWARKAIDAGSPAGRQMLLSIQE